MERTKLKTILVWILYVAVCLCSAALPIAERAIRRNLIGKEDREDGCGNTVYYRHRSDYRGI